MMRRHFRIHNATLVAGVIAAACLTSRLQAQAAKRDDSSFVAAVRQATSRYRDRDVAVRDGYRSIGPDIPSMGEHWINVPMLLTGTIDPLRPPILEYALIGDRIELVGVAYAALVDSGGTLPRGFPAEEAAWHFHAGTVDEESFILSHGHAPAATAAVSGPRVAVLHLWAWVPNPAGAFATDNWALPWLRMGWEPPSVAAEDAAGRAIALVAGGEPYFSAVINAMSHPDSAQQAQVRAVFLGARASIVETLGVQSGTASPRAERLAIAALQFARAWDEALAVVHPHH